MDIMTSEGTVIICNSDPPYRQLNSAGASRSMPHPEGVYFAN